MHIRRPALTACLPMVVILMVFGAPTGARADDSSPLTALVDAAAQRLQTADPVAAVKWQTRSDIEDRARVDHVLAAVTADAMGRGVDSSYVSRIFTDQIDATEAIEYTRFSQWKLDPASAPTAAPDLSASRAVIDDLDQTMVSEIASNRGVLRSPQCAAALDDATRDVAARRQLDSLYRQALTFATHSYCPPA